VTLGKQKHLSDSHSDEAVKRGKAKCKNTSFEGGEAGNNEDWRARKEVSKISACKFLHTPAVTRLSPRDITFSLNSSFEFLAAIPKETTGGVRRTLGILYIGSPQGNILEHYRLRTKSC